MGAPENKPPEHYWQRQGKVKTWKWRHTGRMNPRLGLHTQNLVPADNCNAALGFEDVGWRQDPKIAKQLHEIHLEHSLCSGCTSNIMTSGLFIHSLQSGH